MDRLPVIVAAAVTAVASVAAVAAAVTSEDDSGGGGTVSEAPVAADAVAVEIRDFAFGPPEVAVPAGGQVLWTNADGVAHSVVADDGAFTSPDLAEGASFSFVSADPGTYPYFCGIHDSMRGTVVVEP